MQLPITALVLVTILIIPSIGTSQELQADLVGSWVLCCGPRGLTVSEAGAVYVITGNQELRIFDLDGADLGGWGGQGFDDGLFLIPYGVGIDELRGHVYVTDTGRNDVQRFDFDGQFIDGWGERGTLDGQFASPTDVVIDDDGNIYVTDSLNRRVQKFSQAGEFLESWGGFSLPTCLHIDQLGLIYVTDGIAQTVTVLTTSGTEVARWSVPGEATGICTDDSAGRVYVTLHGNNKLLCYDRSGNLLLEWCAWGQEFDDCNGPWDVGVSSAGRVYVSQKSNHRIHVYEVGPPEPVRESTSSWGHLKSVFGDNTN